MTRLFQPRVLSAVAITSLGILAAEAIAVDCDQTSVGLTPINDLGAGLYRGQFEGGLYFGGNTVPPPHRQVGVARAQAVQPLDVEGNPDSAGKYVLLSIGMSNTTQEFSTFIDLVSTHPMVDTQSLVVVDGAEGGQGAGTWVSPDASNYDRILEMELAPLGLSEAQVQAAWVKLANPRPEVSLPNPNADAFLLLDRLGDTVRAMRVRYPNLQVVFLSSRIYAGYATSALNPEPFAYESGFSVKWLIEAQIMQHVNGEVDPIAGDLSYDDETGVAPWLAWGPYMWADGLTPRSDGLIWECNDLAQDGTHPSDEGREKVADMLLDFLHNAPFSRPWFRGDPVNADFNMDGTVDELDRDMLCAALGTSSGEPGFLPRIDLNSDGTIDHLDQALFNTVLPPCVVDTVSSATLQPPADGFVDGADLAFLLGAWGSAPSCADVVRSEDFALIPDGTVDGADLAALLSGWGACP